MEFLYSSFVKKVKALKGWGVGDPGNTWNPPLVMPLLSDSLLSWLMHAFAIIYFISVQVTYLN